MDYSILFIFFCHNILHPILYNVDLFHSSKNVSARPITNRRVRALSMDWACGTHGPHRGSIFLKTLEWRWPSFSCQTTRRVAKAATPPWAPLRPSPPVFAKMYCNDIYIDVFFCNLRVFFSPDYIWDGGVQSLNYTKGPAWCFVARWDWMVSSRESRCCCELLSFSL